MTQFFKRAMGFQGIPPGWLPKFHENAERPGERSLREWLEDFEHIVAPLDMTDKEKARVMVEHLTGSAKEEIMCLPTGKRDSVKEIKKVLKLRQEEQETLADFSRALMRLYGKMEAMSPCAEEANALKKLRDRSLKDQFASGARDAWVRRELRRISLANKDEGFEKMRQEALHLFREPASSATSVRAWEVRMEDPSTSVETIGPSGPLVKELVDSHSKLVSQVSSMRDDLAIIKMLRSEIDGLKATVNQ
ncbi:hypothetical protein HOLleu_38204 [Holothuria leucospilota]|uniref:Uncharacterized protein n=1 Tax=Holothuria leucospilota TaxID=206669 RepID=A0A9Q0YPY0_HOLLE|nr:hypothetical protein HOLleu_38204 [Holothuria leucospilota]